MSVRFIFVDKQRNTNNGNSINSTITQLLIDIIVTGYTTQVMTKGSITIRKSAINLELLEACLLLFKRNAEKPEMAEFAI